MRRAIAALLVLVMIGLLSACGGGGGSVPSSVAASTPAPVSVPEPEPEPEPEPAFEMGTLRIPKKWGVRSEGSAVGLDLSHLTDDNYILLRVDYETMTETPWCGVQGCPHRNESCPAYKPRESVFSEVYSMANGYFVVNEQLLILRQYEPQNKEHSTFTLERMNADMTAREVFVEIPGRLNAGTEFVTDDRWLFLDVYNYGDAIDSPLLQMEPEETCLLRIDLTSGEVEKMRSMKNRSLFGCDGDALLMWSFDVEPAETVAWRPQYDEETELPLMPDALEHDDFTKEQMFYAGVNYYVRTPEGENARLLGWRPATGEVTLDVELPGDDCKFVAAADGYLEAKHDGVYYFINLSTGEIIEPPLMVEDGSVPARIEAVYNGYYIVISAYHLVNANLFGMWQQRSDSVLARIAIEDYWAGVANYTPMAMWRG